MGDREKIRVVELFAGVGGFRIGLERANPDLFEVVWANQWEPEKKVQFAFDCYTRNFTKGIHVNEDIAKVPNEVFEEQKPDLIVGGFPCQDYSVARSLSGEKGIQGKKGVLFWEIKRAIENSFPKYVLLENVDRLLKSPSKQRGRDFAVMLATFRDLGYTVEWRVINAADYGHAQRRRRIFIFAYKNGITFDKEQRELTPEEIVYKEGFFAKPFPIEQEPYKNRIAEVVLPLDIVDISDNFSFNFHPSGIMRDGDVYTVHQTPIGENPVPLKDILVDESEVDEKYYLTKEMEEKFAYLRGPKKIERTSSTGHKYIFSEGGMSPTDDLDKPGRTMLTSEGTVNRSTHIVEVNGRKRFLTPVECERLNEFPDNWTKGMTDRQRYFCMGNALVVGLVEKMGKRIVEIQKESKNDIVQLDLFSVG
ncbi:DNA (cytosine-5-)-methyltransferase [Pallidibacillus pasinlerensis]|uniref:Cytosine-specific methyltransferase n=1 Tax=Pallidibacillus pasinlerensis TaxID=2703818 RepID=A0ABX0A266_9BACI|nr:DNA (cytosine-5-)-methyltransferase [Pallidibacillus pasinlerensis]NCU17456.1 DNA (cytosine-5-)-methyltransferase [Pallidibacillus pasinlerensis]